MSLPKMPSGRDQKDTLLQYAKKRFGGSPKYPWSSAPSCAYLRHTDNKNWYALVIDVSNKKLSLQGEGRTDIVEIKCQEEFAKPLLAKKKIFPAFLMRKKDWYAIPLDGSLEFAQIYKLLEMSFILTHSDKTNFTVLKQLPDLDDPFHDAALDLDDDQTSKDYYKPETIRLPPKVSKKYTPKEYGGMRKLEIRNPFSQYSGSQIFYLQAKYMERFEDNCPYNGFACSFYYPPSYKNFTVRELRGYFTWRTYLRHGKLQITSIDFAFIYMFELINRIGCASIEEAFDKLVKFYEEYGALDTGIKPYAKHWIVGYAVYHNLSVDKILPYVDIGFDKAFDTLQKCGKANDAQLLEAILRLSSYGLDKSRAYKLLPDEMTRIICSVYRKLNERYVKRYQRPYTDKIFGKPLQTSYYPFDSALFFNRENRDQYEYRIGPIRRYLCNDNLWTVVLPCEHTGTSAFLGELVRTADRLVREAYDIKVSLQPRNENKSVVQFVLKAIEDEKKNAVPKVEFDLTMLSAIRKTSEDVGQKLLTEEERYDHEDLNSQTDSPSKTQAKETTVPNGKSILDGNELSFMRILLYGGNLKDFLSQRHLMASVVAEAVNERLYDEFADTVIEFEDETPVIVKDYLEDLKGMITN